MELYLPPSDFLQSLIEDDEPLSGPDAENNVRQVVALMRDGHPANRDWATLLLSQQDLDTSAIRAALLSAAEDEDENVRAEAICGLAKRDKVLALPLLQRELRRDSVSVPVFEAAVIVADPSLVDDLRDFATPSDHAWIDELAIEALEACEAVA